MNPCHVNMAEALWTGLIPTVVNAQQATLVRGVKPTLMNVNPCHVNMVEAVWTGLIPTVVNAQQATLVKGVKPT